MIAHFSEFTARRCPTNDDSCEDGRESFTTPDPLDLRITTPGRKQEEAVGVDDPSSLEQESDRLGDHLPGRLPSLHLDMATPTTARNPLHSDHINEDNFSKLDKESSGSGLKNTVSIDLIISAQMSGGNNMKSDMVRSQSDDKSKGTIKQQGKTIEFAGDRGSKEVGRTLAGDCDTNGACDNEKPAAGAARGGNNGGLRRSGSSCSNESRQRNGICVNKETGGAEIVSSDVESGNISEPVTPLPSATTQLLDCSVNGANCRNGMSFAFDEIFAELDLRPSLNDEATTSKGMTEDTTQLGELTTDGMTEGHSEETMDSTESPKSLVCHTESTTMLSENDLDSQETLTSECEELVEAATEDPARKSDSDVNEDGLLSELEGLKAFEIGLSGRDQKIVLALMELEELRGKQHDMKHEIQVENKL